MEVKQDRPKKYGRPRSKLQVERESLTMLYDDLKPCLI